MRKTFLFALLPLAVACTAAGKWSQQDALASRKLEIQVDGRGRHVEVEYHVPPDLVPAAVRDAMDELHPGGTVTGAEKEWGGKTLYWELTKKVGGREVEAMFEPDGTLFQQEIEVAAAAVPQAVVKAVGQRLSGGRVTKWEEIRNANQGLIEYHAKVTRGGQRYKVMVGADANVRGVVREIPAEIEVPE